MTAGTLGQNDLRIAEILEHARAAVNPALRGAVGTLPGAMRRISGYHLGWWDEHGIPRAGGTGKAVRPALVLTAARALGARTDADAVPGAVAVELVHNFTLLHDDVMDQDALRRHRATAWTLFGTADAILAGDAMQALATAVMAQDTHPAAAPAAGLLPWMTVWLPSWWPGPRPTE